MTMGAPYVVHGIAIATAALAVVVVVFLTFEGMLRLGRAYNRHRRHAGGAVGRWKVMRLVFGLIALHTLSILVFGSAYWFLLHVPEAGTIEGASRHATLFDAFYLSAMTYSTVGFGDLIPRGPIRWVAGTEALTGLMMVAWSASFAFIEMSRHWRDDLR